MAARGFGPVSQTSLVTLWFRAVDARSAHPILADPFAVRVVQAAGVDERRLLPLRPFYAETVARARRLDDLTHSFVAAHPDAVVVQLACGLDSRVFRVDPPRTVTWFDLDLPPVITLRRSIYPRRPGARTIAASATDVGWWSTVPADRPLLLIAEGLFMYLDRADVEQILRAGVAYAPQGEVLFDGVAGWIMAATGLAPHWPGRSIRFRSAMPTPRTLRGLGLRPSAPEPGTALVRRYLAPGPARTLFDVARFTPWLERAHLVQRATF